MARVFYQCKRGKKVLDEGYLDDWSSFHEYAKRNFPGRCKSLSGRLVEP